MSPRLGWLALCAIALLTAAVSVRILVGPVDLSGLKDWQPLMASIIALCAAGFAYNAATSKVNFDRDMARKTAIAARIGLLLRLKHAALVFSFQVNKRAREVTVTAKSRYDDGKFTMIRSELEFTPPVEIDEAWSKLELIPPEAIKPLGILRLTDNLEHFETVEIALDDEGQIVGSLADFLEVCGDIEQEALSLVAALDAAIEDMRKADPVI